MENIYKDFIKMQGFMHKYKRENQLKGFHSNLTRIKGYITVKEYPKKPFIYIMFFSKVKFDLYNLGKGFFEGLGKYINEINYVEKLREFVPVIILEEGY